MGNTRHHREIDLTTGAPRKCLKPETVQKHISARTIMVNRGGTMALGEIAEKRTYLTFTLDQEDFAVDVVGVREVLDYTTVTRVPRTPDFMKGVINLRGSVVPVVDMRLKFGLQEAEKGVDTCVIVLEVVLDGEVTIIGAIADSVKEVFELESSDIEPPPRLGTRFDTAFISGMGKHNDGFIIILDVNKVFSTQEMELFRQTDEELQQAPLVPERHKEGKPKDTEDPGVEVVTQDKEKGADNEPVSEKQDTETAPAKKAAKTGSVPRKSISPNSDQDSGQKPGLKSGQESDRKSEKTSKKTKKPSAKKS